MGKRVLRIGILECWGRKTTPTPWEREAPHSHWRAKLWREVLPIIPLFHYSMHDAVPRRIAHYSNIPIFPDGAWGVLSIRRSFSFNFTLFLETFVLETFCPEGAKCDIIQEEIWCFRDLRVKKQ